MTDAEFKRWWKHHTARFTGIRTWLGKFPETSGGETTRSDVTAAWRDVLRRVDYDDAIEATDRMYAGDETPPRGYDSHPAAVRAIAMKLHREVPNPVQRPKYVGGKETFRCVQCRDDGMVGIYHPETVEAARRPETFDPASICSAVVRCTCSIGSAKPDRLGSFFDAKRHCRAPEPCRMNDPEEIERLLAFAKGLGAVENLENYEPAFEEFA